MRTGDAATTTGIYRTDCACRAPAEVRRGAEFPPCPSCGKRVAWVFQRSTFVPGSAPAPQRGDASGPRRGPAPRAGGD